MEQSAQRLASGIALALETAAALLIAAGAAQALWRAARQVIKKGAAPLAEARHAWLGFAAWLTLGLEFTLAADVVRTAIAPSWTSIGQLAAIALIRTGLSYFLNKDMREVPETLA